MKEIRTLALAADDDDFPHWLRDACRKSVLELSQLEAARLCAARIAGAKALWQVARSMEESKLQSALSQLIGTLDRGLPPIKEKPDVAV